MEVWPLYNIPTMDISGMQFPPSLLHKVLVTSIRVTAAMLEIEVQERENLHLISSLKHATLYNQLYYIYLNNNTRCFCTRSRQLKV